MSDTDPSIIEEDQSFESSGEVEDQQPTETQETQQENPSSDITSAIQEGFKNLQQSQPEQAVEQPKLTEEEINERLKITSFTEQDASSFREAILSDENPQLLIDFLNGMHGRMTQQHNTYAQLLNQKSQMDMNEQYGPVANHINQQKQEAIKERFYGANESLRDFAKVIPFAAKELAETGKTFANETEEFQALAKQTEKIIQEFNPEFKLGQAKSGEQPKPATSLGGGSGGATGDSVSVNIGADPAIR